MKVYKYIRTRDTAISITDGNNAFVKVPIPPEGSVSKIAVLQTSGTSTNYAIDLFDKQILPEGQHSTALPSNAELYRVFPTKTATAGNTITDYTTGEAGYSYRNTDDSFTESTRCLWLHIRPEPAGTTEFSATILIESNLG